MTDPRSHRTAEPQEAGRIRTLLPLGALALLWIILISELRIEWTTNPQYSYGWVVPLLCIGLLIRRWHSFRGQELRPTADAPTTTDHRPPTTDYRPLWLCLLCAFLIFPLRLFLEATPGWRTLNILFTVCVVALSMIGLCLAAGRRWALNLAFPICFILVAVPWPHSVESPIIQGLTQANAGVVIEILGVVGIPAVQHGNLIEVGAGTVGLGEACSGIRSFQSSLMISLFFGEYYRLNLKRRLLLVPIGFLVAFGFNVCRTTILTWIGAKKGVAAISEYHDQAGLSILLACGATMWGIAWILKRGSRNAKPTLGRDGFHSVPEQEVGRGWNASLPTMEMGMRVERVPTESGILHPAPSILPRFALGLLLWLVMVEIGVELWYRAHEARSAKAPEWTLDWPPQEMGFREVPVPEKSREMLRYDEGHSGVWNAADGARWQMFYFRWLPGRLSVSSARSHNPNICLAAAGKELRPLENDRSPIQVGPLTFPFRRYEFVDSGRVVHVFHCLWEEHATGTYYEFDPNLSQLQMRLEAVLAGRRNRGQRSIEIVVAGIDDPEFAVAAVASQLKKLVRVAGGKEGGAAVPAASPALVVSTPANEDP